MRRNPGLPLQQRGAATVIAAVFLIISVSLMANAILHVAGSDISDTALQGDAIEALFAAEAGLEHASYLYANGTACAALAGITETNVGRGEFTITNAQVVGPLCQVRVQGRVQLDANLYYATRTIEGELRLNQQQTVLAVGDGGTALLWDGAAWVDAGFPTGANLNGVYCGSANDCWVVGSGGTAYRWDGANWTANNGFGGLTGVACVDTDTNNCHASGQWSGSGVVESWTGGPGWSSTLGTAFNQYRDVTCTLGRCYTVDNNGAIYRTPTAATSWALDGNVGNQLNGAACTGDDVCWAVGQRITGGGGGYAIYGRNGGGWFTNIVASNPERDLLDVDCIGPDQCWAVGQRRSGGSFTFAKRNGANWTIDTPSLGVAEDLNGVSCITDGQCWAVGNNGVSLYWDGSGWNGSDWTVVATPTGNDLNDVFFLDGAGGGAGAVTLVNWREIVL